MLMPDCKHVIIFSFFQTRKDFFFEKKKQKTFAPGCERLVLLGQHRLFLKV
jgi:hypothetical protein